MEIIDLIIQISLRDYCSKITPMKFTNQSIDSYISKIPEYSFAIKKSYIDSLPNTTFLTKSTPRVTHGRKAAGQRQTLTATALYICS